MSSAIELRRDSTSRAGPFPAPTASATQLVLIPSYNTGEKVFETVREARRYWNPVWVIVDGNCAR